MTERNVIRKATGRTADDTALRLAPIMLLAEYKWGPLRSEEFGDFNADGPVFALGLSDGLVTDIGQWATDFNENMEMYLRERDDSADTTRRVALDVRGQELADRLRSELGPFRDVEYGGLA